MTENPYGNIIMICLLLVAFYFMMIAPYVRDRYFQKHAIKSTGKIVKVIRTQIEYGDGIDASRLYEFILEITLADGQTKRVEVKHAYDRHSEIPEPGDKMYILIHPKNPDKVRLA